MIIRPLQAHDREPIRGILRDTAVFNEEEIQIALELIDTVLNIPHQKDYEIVTGVDEKEEVVGYVCVGPTPATVATYDLYWIAVDPKAQGKGNGVALMRWTEEHIAEKGGRLIVAETSSTGKYAATRRFYLKCGYEQLAQIREYYRPGDDLVVYGKYLSQHR
ncbi:MAG: GNAT family N-acetyltransferase [Ignavibacteriales bacterium]|nr:GNAT family N-acetyltransferase [Ignavibacteriales bacterium]